MSGSSRRVSFGEEKSSSQDEGMNTNQGKLVEDESEWFSPGSQNQQNCSSIWSWMFGPYGNNTLSDTTHTVSNSQLSPEPALTSAVLTGNSLSPQMATNVYPRSSPSVNLDVPVRKPISFQTKISEKSSLNGSPVAVASPMSAAARAQQERERLKRKAEEDAIARQKAQSVAGKQPAAQPRDDALKLDENEMKETLTFNVEIEKERIQSQKQQEEAMMQRIQQDLARQSAEADAIALRNRALEQAEETAKNIRRRLQEMDEATARAKEETIREEQRRQRRLVLQAEVERRNSCKDDANKLLDDTLKKVADLNSNSDPINQIITVPIASQTQTLENAIVCREAEAQTTTSISIELERARLEGEKLALDLLARLSREAEELNKAATRVVAEEAANLQKAINQRLLVEAAAAALMTRIKEANEQLDTTIYQRLVHENEIATAKERVATYESTVTQLEEAIMNKIAEEEHASDATSKAEVAKKKAEEMLEDILRRLVAGEASVIAAENARAHATALERAILDRIEQEEAAAIATASANKAKADVEMLELSMLKKLAEKEIQAAAAAQQEAEMLEQQARQRIAEEEDAAKRRSEAEARKAAEAEKKRLAEEAAAAKAIKMREEADRLAAAAMKKRNEEEAAAAKLIEVQRLERIEAEKKRIADEEASRAAIARAKEEAGMVVAAAREAIAAEKRNAELAAEAEAHRRAEEEKIRLAKEKMDRETAEMEAAALAARRKKEEELLAAANLMRIQEEKDLEDAKNARLAAETAAALDLSRVQQELARKQQEIETAERHQQETAVKEKQRLAEEAKIREAQRLAAESASAQRLAIEEENLKLAAARRLEEEKAAEKARLAREEVEKLAARQLAAIELAKLQIDKSTNTEAARDNAANSNNLGTLTDDSIQFKPRQRNGVVGHIVSGLGRTESLHAVGGNLPLEEPTSNPSAPVTVVIKEDSITALPVVDYDAATISEEEEPCDMPIELYLDEDTERFLLALKDIDRRTEAVLNDILDLTGEMREVYASKAITTAIAAYEPDDYVLPKWYYVPRNVPELQEFERLWFVALQVLGLDAETQTIPQVECYQFLLKSNLSFDLVEDIVNLYGRYNMFTKGRFFCALRYVSLVQDGAIQFFKEHVNQFNGVEVAYPTFDVGLNVSTPTYPRVAMWDGYTPLTGDMDEEADQPTKRRSYSISKSVSHSVEVAPSMPKGPIKREPRGPAEHKGYLRQEGNVLKSWKKKYFLLSEGLLYSFGSEKDAELMKINGWEPLLLAGYQISNPSKRFMKLTRGEQDREIVLDAANVGDLAGWMAALSTHISFSNSENPQLVTTSVTPANENDVVAIEANGKDSYKSSDSLHSEDKSYELVCTTESIEAIPLPEPVQGYLRHEGLVLKSWKKKYFLLSEGLLYSFGSEKDAELMKINGWEPLLLAGYQISNPSKRFMKLTRGEKDRLVMLDAASAPDLSKWLAGFRSHIGYAKHVADEIAAGRRQMLQVTPASASHPEETSIDEDGPAQ